MQRTFVRWQDAAEFSVYLTENATPSQQIAVEGVMHASGLVAGVERVSKDEAMRRFKQNFGALAEATGALASNPLPASIEVRLRQGVDAGGVEALAGRASKMSGVADVRYDRQWIERLRQAVGVVRGVGLVLAAVLVLAAALTVASVVRLALVARHEEIHIMQLVGAPTPYIRPVRGRGVDPGRRGRACRAGPVVDRVSLRSNAPRCMAGRRDRSRIARLSVGARRCRIAGGRDGGGLDRRADCGAQHAQDQG
jgi:cell division transport system permease protein